MLNDLRLLLTPITIKGTTASAAGKACSAEVALGSAKFI